MRLPDMLAAFLRNIHYKNDQGSHDKDPEQNDWQHSSSK